MALPSFIMTREQYEARCRARLEEAFGDDADRIERVLARRYPATIEQAVEELHTRGLSTTPEQFPELARNVGIEPRVIGRNRVWYPDEIDAFAEALASLDRLSHEAVWRRARGLSVAEQTFLEREANGRRLANLKRVADAVGVEIPDVNDLVSEKGLRDPIEWDEYDIHQVIALFAERREAVSR